MVDVPARSEVARSWPDLRRPVPPGSLLKPFAALAYAEGHGFRYPEFVCRGAADGCWLRRGHGRIGITQAVEFSCNAYFRQLSARAYLNLVAQSDEPGVEPLLRGMALSTQAGKASAIGRALGGRAALSKTGTAPCVHAPRAPGDGYVVVLYPAESPRWVLLVRVHGVPGAEAAKTAARSFGSRRTGRRFGTR